MKNHIVLVGDSIFDNAVYVGENEAVPDHLKQLLPGKVKSTLLAVDGSISKEVPNQLKNIPHDTTHIFISTGGNDALAAKSVIDGDFMLPEFLSNKDPVKEIDAYGNFIDLLALLQQEFKNNYKKAITSAIATGKPVTVCTIYDSVPGLEPRHRAALSLFNDVIITEAVRNNISIIDLRMVCNESADYSEVSPIEPSSQGGHKIAEIIAKVYRQSSKENLNTVIYS